MDVPKPEGLREAKKLATRQALSLAAFRLAQEHGLDNVRVEAIAAAAGVSPRTYNNYFSSREEAICAVSTERAERLGALVRARPGTESLAEALTGAIIDQYGGGDPDRGMIQLIMSAPTLAAEFFRVIGASEHYLVDAIAERLGADPDDLGPRVLAMAANGAHRAATRHWMRPGNTEPFHDVLRAAMDLVTPMADALEAQC